MLLCAVSEAAGAGLVTLKYEVLLTRRKILSIVVTPRNSAYDSNRAKK